MFVLVRHAEKADSTPESPLSAAGRERAHDDLFVIVVDDSGGITIHKSRYGK